MQGKKIFVGISGGVDSSVAVALLKKQGHEVVGVFIRTWQPEWIQCTWKQERRDAMRVCAHLEIPFIELDLEKEYKEGVVDYMISEYRAGRTPNPDVMCNKEVKFGGFLKWALKHGGDFVATGHYARRSEKDGIVSMLRGVDQGKDQSYFLWTLTQEQLKHILFPVGELQKSEVRKEAERFGLPTAQKKDSQGICFIGEIDMKDFLRHYIDEQEGDVLDISGNIIGSHTGSLFYTIGERHGLVINSKHKGTDDRPYYVVTKDVKKNTITASQTFDISNNTQEVSLINIIDSQNSLMVGGSYDAQIRYHGNIKKAELISYDKKSKQGVVEFQEGELTITSGQSMVFYRDEVCLGGGIVS